MACVRPGLRTLPGSLFLLPLLLASFPVLAEETPPLRDVDRIRIAEAFRLADEVQDKLWPGWSKAPFALDLVTNEFEFLLRHPNPPADFERIGEDVQLGGAIFARKRTQRTDLLATFPINGVPTIVVGQAEHTLAETSTKWVITLLHEHFHQLQYSQADYQEAVDRLGLSRGDTSGMWMLNYEFPYKDTEVQRRFEELCRTLSAAVS